LFLPLKVSHEKNMKNKVENITARRYPGNKKTGMQKTM